MHITAEKIKEAAEALESTELKSFMFQEPTAGPLTRRRRSSRSTGRSRRSTRGTRRSTRGTRRSTRRSTRGTRLQACTLGLSIFLSLVASKAESIASHICIFA
ncbi:CotG/ExsB N-terminal domain-containing protein, partial [Priestia megaterium]